jgi:hypothetical protein
MKLILRGHIRTAFDTPYLLQFVHILSTMDPGLTIYIHTWDIYSNSISWRPIFPNLMRVTESRIYSYFDSVRARIRHICIEDDTHLPLHGRLDGILRPSRVPRIGWKNYWFGQYSVLRHVYECDASSPEAILNMRFDLFDNSTRIPKETWLDFIWRHGFRLDFTQNAFLYEDESHVGIDNLYIGNIKTQYRLAHAFHSSLDSIWSIHSTPHPEYIVFRMNQCLFASGSFSDIISDLAQKNEHFPETNDCVPP